MPVSVVVATEVLHRVVDMSCGPQWRRWLQQHQDPAGRARSGSAGKRRRLNLEAPRGKLAEVLAADIADDIAASGWQVGSVFGTETALLERYRVSRAALREAVRLLEYHEVAHMRRGPGGGLVVNLLSLWILHAGKDENLNMRGVWLHTLTDALGSLQAVVAGACIWFWHRMVSPTWPSGSAMSIRAPRIG